MSSIIGWVVDNGGYGNIATAIHDISVLCIPTKGNKTITKDVWESAIGSMSEESYNAMQKSLKAAGIENVTEITAENGKLPVHTDGFIYEIIEFTEWLHE